MRIGYARVSTDEQNLDLQRQALEAAGCDNIFEDRISGAAVNRPALDCALASMQTGDVLVVWKLERLGRDLRHLVNLIHDLTARDIGFKVSSRHGTSCESAIYRWNGAASAAFSGFRSDQPYQRAPPSA